jgi:sugar/nucleoside kinase (ribokinase family)
MKEQMEELSSPVDFTVVASQSGDLETAKSIAENSIFTVFIPGSEELKQGQEMINAYMGGNLMSLNLKEANDLLDAVEGADKGDKSEKRTLKSAADAISRLFGEDGEQMNVLVTNGSKGSQISSRNGNESHYVEAYDPSVDFDAEDEESLPKAKYTLGAGDATATVTGFLLAYSNLSPEVAAAYGNKAGFMVCTHTENTLTPEQVLTLFPPTEEEVTVSGIQKAIKMRRSIEKLQAA